MHNTLGQLDCHPSIHIYAKSDLLNLESPVTSTQREGGDPASVGGYLEHGMQACGIKYLTSTTGCQPLACLKVFLYHVFYNHRETTLLQYLPLVRHQMVLLAGILLASALFFIDLHDFMAHTLWVTATCPLVKLCKSIKFNFCNKNY